MPHIGTHPIETERLILRRFTLDDAEAMYHNWANDPEVARFLRWTPYQSVEAVRAFLADVVKKYDEPTTYWWTIVPKEIGQPIGSIAITLFPPMEGEPDWEAGYCIGKAWWGQGYATEALQATVGWFVAHTGITDIGCSHATANPASGAVMRKAGFVYVSAGSYALTDGTTTPSHNYLYQPEGLCPTSKA